MEGETAVPPGIVSSIARQPRSESTELHIVLPVGSVARSLPRIIDARLEPGPQTAQRASAMSASKRNRLRLDPWTTNAITLSTPSQIVGGHAQPGFD